MEQWDMTVGGEILEQWGDKLEEAGHTHGAVEYDCRRRDLGTVG
jgi:hypothetical protein